MTTPRVAILAGLFVAGGLAGAGGTALLATDIGSPTALVAGERVYWDVGPDGGVMAAIDVYNPDERTVSVQPVALGGWDAESGPAGEVAAAGNSWTSLSFEVVPDCTGVAVGTLELMTDDMVRELELTDDVVELLDGRRQTYCGGVGIELEPVVEAGSWDGDTYVLDIRLPGHGRTGLGGVTIDDVMASVPYQVEAAGLPATLPAEGSITLTTRWSFSCSPDAGGPDGETAPYDALFLTTSDGAQIHADVASRLYVMWVRECVESR